MALCHVNFFSNVLGLCMQMDVILPERTQGQIGMEGRKEKGKYRTLYLLHGMSDDNTIWQRRTSIERYATEYGIAVVMPAVGLSWYTDMHTCDRDRYFVYVARELPEICRDFFPNMSPRREDTYVAGLSMGGYGALKCALRAPETFSKAASLSGAVDVAELVKVRALADARYWEGIFGPADKVAGSENDLFALAERLTPEERPDLFMWCGTEDSLYPSNVKLRDHLNKLGYRLTYTEGPGDHQWKYWDEHIQNALRWMMESTVD